MYVGDITYIPTQEGWLYLAVVIDLYSRRVIGWSMDAHMSSTLVNDALFMALKKRHPPHGIIWHTDRGSQYASDAHKALLKEYGIVQSMSAKGNCYDNAVAESFFQALVNEAGLADQLYVDSAGVADWHSGEAADRRTLAVLRQHDIPYIS